MWRVVLWIAAIASLWSSTSAKDDWPLCYNIIETVGMTQPARDIELLAHDDLVITCLLKPEVVRDLGVNASHLRFYHYKDRVMPDRTHKLDVINETALRLTVVDMQPSKSGAYYCVFNKSNHITGSICFNNVIIKTSPQHIKNFSCESNNWRNLTCIWKPDEIEYIPTEYSLQIFLRGRAMRKIAFRCPKIMYDEGFYKCTWTFETSPAYRQAIEVLTFNLTESTGSTNKFSSNTQLIELNHYAIMRPAPPVNLHLVDVSSHMAKLQWSIHHEIYHFPKPFVHKLMYRSELDETWKETMINAHPEQINVTYKLELLYANIQYYVRVFIKTETATDEMWSNFSAFSFKTASTFPDKPPSMNIGSFDSLTIGNKRQVYLYWQQIERYEENGDDLTYKIVSARTDSGRVSLEPTNITQSYMIFDEFPLDRVELHIKSYNSMGYSNNESVMIIPESKKILPKPSGVTKIQYDQGVYKLSWSKVVHPDLESYTIFWCNNREILRCENKVQWVTVPANITSKSITLDNKQYQFAISANSKDSSSGMEWVVCSIVYQKSISIISYVSVNRVGNAFREIVWKTKCPHHIDDDYSSERICCTIAEL